MDHYHIWCNLKPGVSDVEFTEKVNAFLGELELKGLVRAHRITRRKLGLGPKELGEFHVRIAFDDLAQLDRVFKVIAARSGEVEAQHFAANAGATDLTFALYRDFPDPVRKRGEEKF